MAGYSGYSKSNNAVEAERGGKLPLTRAITRLSHLAGCTRREARAALEAVGPCEWHHTSKFFNATDYYDVAEALEHIRFAGDPLGDDLEEVELAERMMRISPVPPISGGSDSAAGELVERRFYGDRPYSGTDSCGNDCRLAGRHGVMLDHAARFRRWEPALRRRANHEAEKRRSFALR